MMGCDNMKRGIKTEREAVNYLESIGICAFRICGSGGGSKRPLTDVMASNNIIDYGIEVKSSKKDYILFEDSQIKRLIKFCDKFGAMPLVCVKFSNEPFVFLKLHHLELTKEGNYKAVRGNLKRSVF